ncbi:MAG: hypothetical protein U9Q80_01315 [Bacillota bacterium]|nr:hypothetical protein [Bacillota bacterium]
MKGYLLLENGTVLPGVITGEYKNTLGNITASDLSSKKIKLNNLVIELCDDSDCIPLNLKTAASMLGKIVVDSLPIDYHLYDLKTTYC